MGLLIKEFWEQYPHYNMGFTASNPKTKTEEIVGLRMHLMYDSETKRTYQEFFLYDKYHQLFKALSDKKPHHIELSINNNTINMLLKIKDKNIIGVCLETGERIAFAKSIKTIVTLKKLNNFPSC